MLQRGITAFVCVAGSSRAESLRFAKSLMPTEAKWLPKGKAESTLGRLDEGEAPRGVGSAARIVLNPMGAGKASGLTCTAAGETRCFLLEKAHLVLFAVVRQPHFPQLISWDEMRTLPLPFYHHVYMRSAPADGPAYALVPLARDLRITRAR